MKRRLINRRPDRAGLFLLGALPFLLAMMCYLGFSAWRLAENPNDKLLPGLAALGRAIHATAFTQDARTARFCSGPTRCRACAGCCSAWRRRPRLGWSSAFRPGSSLYPRRAVAFHRRAVDDPAMAVLPILFIVFGLDELSKVC
ncbi:MAG: hypothetical protein WDN69_34510 [Aliidongia sp.]